MLFFCFQCCLYVKYIHTNKWLDLQGLVSTTLIIIDYFFKCYSLTKKMM